MYFSKNSNLTSVRFDNGEVGAFNKKKSHSQTKILVGTPEDLEFNSEFLSYRHDRFENWFASAEKTKLVFFNH